MRATHQSFLVQENETIVHIENNLFEITKSGADTGSAYSVLERMKKFAVEGMSVTVFDQGKIVWSKGYGFRNKELNLTVDSGASGVRAWTGIYLSLSEGLM